jgi:hypothetical protein
MPNVAETPRAFGEFFLIVFGTKSLLGYSLVASF